MKHLDLSVNVDHVATLRNARGGQHPCPVEASRIAIEAGADGITVHLREDRRHIKDRDVERIRAEVAAPLNFEMAATEEMVAFAERIRPPYCCIVPEKRAELTTEGGLDVLRAGPFLREAVARLCAADVRVSIFIEADAAQIEAAAALGAAAIELHTGTYAEGPVADRPRQLARLQAGVVAARRAGLLCHAGHGLTYETVSDIARMEEVTEISIGHFLISQSVFEGLPAVVRRFKALITAARSA
ncbi:MAG: pyridoxine 5'-phosphate synthase [Roseomonas sp.]|nr:pyridoxine 5'-phosphate synthase [Roseomonas sp.]MCA3328328.1 pyridoxine 5'-phosphate synthase [Roseomonas sp.]MCA3332474.1 pyridoxine 5'-phosphate synthase [Roseomonas sp.]MCA3346596.1 pyridoxine 5'-phosphate synthase [Roseomonas sp.]MCA3353044.1 pyridoxine 5'-phosphate synthase [Roseomonas sp.]